MWCRLSAEPLQPKRSEPHVLQAVAGKLRRLRIGVGGARTRLDISGRLHQTGDVALVVDGDLLSILGRLRGTDVVVVVVRDVLPALPRSRASCSLHPQRAVRTS